MTRSNRSAGLLLFRHGPRAEIEVLIGHHGGPYWANKDENAWSIPKGEYAEGEDAQAAAFREFEEEIGRPPPPSGGELIDLGEVRQRSGKLVRIWALEGDMDVSDIASNLCEVEWPPRSGRIIEIPEIDRAGWFPVDEAERKLVPGQVEFLDRLRDHFVAHPA